MGGTLTLGPRGAGVTRLVTKEQGIFKYFLKVVPTTFKRGFSAPRTSPPPRAGLRARSTP